MGTRYSHRLLVTVVGLLSAGCPPLSGAAQSPDISPKGDPSIGSDTIYKLAVDSSAYPEQASVLLLDDGVIKVEQDGQSRRTWRQVVQILRDRAARAYQERQFTYEPDRQHLTINWVRVLKPSGEVISSEPAHQQESDLPASMVNPVYVHRRAVRMSLAGVAPGTIVDISWSYADTKPYRPGDFYQSWRVTAGTTVRRSRFIVDVPKDVDLRIVEHNLHFAHREAVTGDRKVYTWWTQDVPWIKPELFAPAADSDDLAMRVAIAMPASWSDIGHWYAALASDRERPDGKLRDTLKTIVSHSHTLDDSIRAIHRWVAQDIRYVALELGIGGYQPRDADAVISTGFGDCKDKATLFIASLKAIGVDAYPVLLHAGGRPDPSLPTIGAFNHEIAAVKRATGYEFVDLTSDLSPFGTLPFPDANTFALVVHPDGRTEEVNTPPDPADSNRLYTSLTGALTPDGVFGGRVEIRGTGAAALGLRALMRNRMDSAQRSAFVRSFAGEVFPEAKGDSLVTFDGKDLQAEPRISLVVSNGQATQRSGETDILVLRDASGHWTQLADELEARAPRRQPIDAGKVVGAITTIGEDRITLPEEWHARLPSNVVASSAFGRYEATYQQMGRDLIISHRIAGTAGVLSKDHAPELVAWFRALAKDRVPFIVIDHTTPSTSTAADARPSR
jgi:hypothetical protein